MNFAQTFKMAIKSIMGSKKRSFLTMLGIIIGVASVIALIGLATGATGKITDELEGIGTNLVAVYIDVSDSDSNRNISFNDLQKFGKENTDIIEAVIPSITKDVTAKYANENVVTTLEGTNEFFETAKNTKTSKGRFISALDVEKRQNVAVIGSYIAKKLFPDIDPIGKEMKLNGDVYYVIGIVQEKSSSEAKTADDKIYIPYTSAVRLLQNATISSFAIQAATPDATYAVMEKVKVFLFDIFNDDDRYAIYNQKDMLKSLETMTTTLNTMLGGIAAISLVVGGIGIMNIMLVSVTERTREIGVRKAIGASRGSILVQFLVEAVVLSGLGGLVGIGLGISLIKILGHLMNINAAASFGTIMFSFSFSVAIGVFFGLSPANKASKLRPIEALRSE